MEIEYFDKDKKSIEVEKVYGSKALRWLYTSSSGRLLSHFLVKKPISRIYGAIQSTSLTKRKVLPFIKNFNIQMDDFEFEEGGSKDFPYSTFNNFFIRKFKEGRRSFVAPPFFPAFCEARYFGYESLCEDEQIPVKGKYFTGKSLLANTRWENFFEEGPCLIARLCPVDYHRFHFPDDGEILDYYPISGVLHSVNPLALKKTPEVFSINERAVTIIESQNFGKLAYVEVGALCVGKIVQARAMKGKVERGEEKGYFLFGGSTVIVLGEKGRWIPDDIILENTERGREVYQRLGTPLGKKKG